MGGVPSQNRVFGVYVGEARPGETRVLKNALPDIDFEEPETMVGELR